MNVISMTHQKFEFIYLLSPIVLFYLHCTYGLGTLYGLLILPWWKRNNKNRSDSPNTGQVSPDSPKVN